MTAQGIETIEIVARGRLGQGATVARLAGDASTRCYYRLADGDGRTEVLMDVGAPILAGEDPFLLTAGLFSELGLPVPDILEVLPQKGLVLLEDLGDLLLQRRLVDCPAPERDELYHRAIRHLALLQRRGSAALAGRPGYPAARQALDRERFVFELDYMLEHYALGLRRVRLTDGRTEALRTWFVELSDLVASFGRVLCHRDYHSRNLMIHKGDLFIIDFQDARWGPVTYDIASLLRDSYAELPDEFVDRMLENFRTTMIEERTGEAPSGVPPWMGDAERFRECFDITCIQRNLKALGTFGYQATARDNTVYLRYIPPTAAHVRRNLERFSGRPSFRAVLAVLDETGILP